jgi:hypothetical protein
MKANASFRTILEEKLKTSASFSQTASGAQGASSFQHTADQDPAHLAFLMGTLNKTAFTAPITKVYPAPPKAPKPPPKPHALTVSQQAAYEFFLKYSTEFALETGVELGPAFTQKELKNAFRRLALRLHPDMNKGACGPFISLKTHYEELEQLFDTTQFSTATAAKAA